MARTKDPKKVAAGRKGGLATKARHGAAYLKQIARRGGKTTVARHGTEHMAAIGKLGFQAFADNHFGGDRTAARDWVIRRGLMAQDPIPGNGYVNDPGPLSEQVIRQRAICDEGAARAARQRYYSNPLNVAFEVRCGREVPADVELPFTIQEALAMADEIAEEVGIPF